MPDGDRAKQGDRAVEEKFHPAARYSARWHALSLVEKGNFERDPQNARWLKLKAGAVAPTGKLLREGVDDDKNRPFASKSRPDGQAWFWFHESGAGRSARVYVKSDPLKKLLDAVDKVKALRNDIAHNGPTPDLMNDARIHMQNAALWSDTDTFLSQPLVQAVLKELAEAEPEQLLVNLLAEVRRRLVAPAWRWRSSTTSTSAPSTTT